MAMPSGSDHHNNDYYNSQPSGFLTPPPTWRTRRCSPVMPGSEKKPRRSPQSRDYLFHVIYKVPSGDSPYVRAKHAQLIDKDPSRAISLFWAAINSGDRVDSALKDMAVVMKQLDRSDEAIEAIKSFRHLCPSESQESLDNILVELYKQSGRIEEEIEILQIKLKQVEEGIAFGGKRTKMARSQGKKTQITIEKEYSRLLGNLAWAYMQKRDFKFAEEHYRKALSFESDKNKQCNLAICLMHMNKLTEAKFLLQAIKVSSDNGGQIDESHAKSYERAYEMLVEFESQAMKHRQHTNDNNGMQSSSPLPSSVNKMHNGAFTDFPYEKRADSDRGTNRYQLKIGQEEGYSQPKRTHESSPSCNRIVQKVPFTQPRRRSRSGDQRMGGFTDNSHGFSCRKLAFGSSTVPFDEMPQFSEKNFTSTGQEWRKNSSVKMSETNLDGDLPSDSMTSSEDGRKTKEILTNSVHIGTSDTKDERNLNLQTGWRRTCELSTCQHKKSWADMVEEDERDLGRCLQNCSGKFGVGLMDHQERFNDENVDSNIIPETPKSLNEAEKLSQKIELIDLGSGYFTQPENNTTLQVNPSARRSLCFDQDVKKCGCTSPLTTRVLKFEEQDEGALSKDFSSMKSMKRRNRLQVFRDITLVSESPRH